MALMGHSLQGRGYVGKVRVRITGRDPFQNKKYSTSTIVDS
jgi:hypothetical protein